MVDSPVNCIKLKISPKDLLLLDKLDPEHCYSITTLFEGLMPGKYKLKATLTFGEGEPIIMETFTNVEPEMEATLNVGIVMVTYTLTRLKLTLCLK